MRLADQIIAAQGGTIDRTYFGAISSVAKALGKAGKFELSDDVAEACRNVARSKPSSILSALPTVGLPFPRVWAEWPMHPERPGADPECPLRVGCLYEGWNPHKGMMTWCWTHSA